MGVLDSLFECLRLDAGVVYGEALISLGERSTMFGRSVRKACADTQAMPPLAASDKKVGQNCVPMAPFDSLIESARLARGVASRTAMIRGWRCSRWRGRKRVVVSHILRKRS